MRRRRRRAAGDTACAGFALRPAESDFVEGGLERAEEGLVRGRVDGVDVVEVDEAGGGGEGVRRVPVRVVRT